MEKIGSKIGSRTALSVSCTILSFNVGIPRGLVFPFDFGMRTLLMGVHSKFRSITDSRRASSFAMVVPSRVMLSVPGVLLPLDVLTLI